MEGNVQQGCRVVVPFGPSKYYTGIVSRVHSCPPKGVKLKEVMGLPEGGSVVFPDQLKLWEWVADYYLCPLGDVYKAALPSGLKLESETLVELAPEADTTTELTGREAEVMERLKQRGAMSLSRLEKDTGRKYLLPVVRSLMDKGLVAVKERLKDSYRPKIETRVRLTPGMKGATMLHITLDQLKRRAPSQYTVLMKYLELSGYVPPEERTPGTTDDPLEVSRAELARRSGASPAIIAALIKNKVLEAYDCQVGRLSPGDSDAPLRPPHELNPYQRQAYQDIKAVFLEKNVCLLHGVTSSGKTEIYINLIADMLAAGKQVLYLLPEIALTAQITARLRAVFGHRLGVYHSKFPDAERVEVWQKQLGPQPFDIILGVRSSVYLPFQRLGLVIVDEEHETTYKQQDPAPRYHARNTAIILAAGCGAKVLLGTATPSLESWHNAQTGKYGLVTLTYRHSGFSLPRIVPVDVKELSRKRLMQGAFSPTLVEAVRTALEHGQQAILFQNRRGFAPLLECHACGWVPRCARCDVSLAYHRATGTLVCHYCGYTQPVNRRCPSCGSNDVRSRGFGTERIEDECSTLFPNAVVERMDLDTTRSRQAYERIIDNFSEGRTDILIGTQMVSKGLDFRRVSVVGILDADSMLNYPDFRSYERTFQLMAQVAGRAGRHGEGGLVILQTRNVEHPVVEQVMQHDFQGMAAGQLAERQLFRYPPYYRLTYIYLRHRDEAALETLAPLVAELLRQMFKERVLGPDKPPVARVQGWFIRKIMLKIEAGADLAQARRLLRDIERTTLSQPGAAGLQMVFDVDPM